MKRRFLQILLIFMLVIILLLGVPILLDYLLSRHNPISQLPIIGEAKDWLSFWGTYIGSIGTIGMAAIALVTIRQNDKLVRQNDKLVLQNETQLAEMKRQWEEDRRACLSFGIIVSNNSFYVRIKNIGKRNASNIKLQFNDEFLNCLIKDIYREMFRNVERVPFVIEQGECKYLFIGFCDQVSNEWKDKKVVLRITGCYCDKYQVDETFYMEEYIAMRFMKVTDDTTAAITSIKQGLVCPNKNHLPIQESLDIIAKQIETSN